MSTAKIFNFLTGLRRGNGVAPGDRLQALLPDREMPDNFSVQDTALLVVDMQRDFCRSVENDAVAGRVNARLPHFRQAGLPIYHIYLDREGRPLEDINFQGARPLPGDFVIRKDHDSAFVGSKIDAHLRSHGYKNILGCGFNLSDCAGATFLGGRAHGYNVAVLKDLVGDHWKAKMSERQETIRKLAAGGVTFLDSGSALVHFARAPQPASQDLAAAPPASAVRPPGHARPEYPRSG